ncbi:hypothetical protein FACS189475_00080 [Betaproteobacteria bacterium]|nr:hypothetical protein FACS189475_00080 [Betaproteobacteria bacterium]
MRRGLTLSVTLVAVILLGACEYLAEGAKGVRSPSYSEEKEALKNRKPLSPEQLEKVYGECPKPNGIFKNEADVKNVSQLEDYFLVEGFEIPATSFPGGREDDEPLPSSSSPINLLGGEKNGVRQHYYQQRTYQERFTLELRPLGLGRFHIGVTSSLTGRSAESDRGWINSLGGQVHCENGVLKGFWKKYDKTVLGWEFFVDEESGDIVVHSPLPPERYYRFKRIGK